MFAADFVPTSHDRTAPRAVLPQGKMMIPLYTFPFPIGFIGSPAVGGMTALAWGNPWDCR
jgi:hypothetical protein